MLCDKYKEALVEAAASGAALPSALSEHVNLCARCREMFAAQQSLFTLVDAGLLSRANVAVPGNFDHRLRAALHGVAQDRKRHAAVLGFSSLAAAAAVLIAILLTQTVKHGGKETAGNSVADSKLVASPHPPVLTTGNATRLGRRSPRKVYERVNGLRATQGSKASVSRQLEPEVLVPQGQEELLAKYMEGMAGRKARVTFSADLQHEPNMKPVELPAIEISELVVRPLADLSSN
jgi:hypothetical protein